MHGTSWLRRRATSHDDAVLHDEKLVQRIERTAALGDAAYAQQLAMLEPDSGALAVPLGGGQLVLMGPGMYVNRGVGMGLGVEVRHDDLDQLERLSAQVGVPAEVQICPWAHPSLIALTALRRYVPTWFRSVLVRTLGREHDEESDSDSDRRARNSINGQAGSAGDVATSRISEDDDSGSDRRAEDGPGSHAGRPAEIAISNIGEDELAVWQDTVAAGFGYDDGAQRAISDRFVRAAFAVDGETLFLARVDGQAVGTAALTVREGVAILGGMTTIRSARRRGVQGALIRRRLAVATQAECDLALSTAEPGSVSERNLLRNGFELVYTQLAVRRRAGSPI